MQTDAHKIWRIVRNNLESLKQAAPEGYAPVVDVYLVGRSEPVRLGEVHTTRDPAFQWTLLVTETDNILEERLVFAPSQYVERVEVPLMPSESVPDSAPDTFPIEWAGRGVKRAIRSAASPTDPAPKGDRREAA
jgi:hypothetical protein